MALAMIKHDGCIRVTHSIQGHSAIYIGVIRPDDMTRRNFNDVFALIGHTAFYPIAHYTEGRPAC